MSRHSKPVCAPRNEVFSDIEYQMGTDEEVSAYAGIRWQLHLQLAGCLAKARRMMGLRRYENQEGEDFLIRVSRWSKR